MMDSITNKKGVVAITIVIVVSAVLLAGGVNLLLNNIDLTRSAINYRSRTINKTRSRSCFEDTIYRIRKDKSYTGSLTITLPNGDCAATTSDAGSGVKTIVVNGTYYEYEYSDTFNVDTTTYPYSVSQ